MTVLNLPEICYDQHYSYYMYYYYQYIYWSIFMSVLVDFSPIFFQNYLPLDAFYQLYRAFNCNAILQCSIWANRSHVFPRFSKIRVAWPENSHATAIKYCLGKTSTMNSLTPVVSHPGNIDNEQPVHPGSYIRLYTEKEVCRNIKFTLY